MSSKSSCIWIIGPQLVALFGGGWGGTASYVAMYIRVHLPNCSSSSDSATLSLLLEIPSMEERENSSWMFLSYILSWLDDYTMYACVELPMSSLMCPMIHVSTKYTYFAQVKIASIIHYFIFFLLIFLFFLDTETEISAQIHYVSWI